MRLKYFIFWGIAISVTLAAAIYQRQTGPTYPLDFELKCSKSNYNLQFVRSHGGPEDCKLEFVLPDYDITGEVSYRRFPTVEAWVTKDLLRQDSLLIGQLPHQDPAGKIEYRVMFYKSGKQISVEEDMHTVVRFKGSVPSWALLPHIFFMFFAMLLSNYTCIIAIDKHERTLLYTYLTLVFLFLGGLVFGPVVQLYAFGELWAGIPFGWDLTDNKTLIAFIVWLFAALVSIRQKRVRYDLIIAAAIVMLVVFSIPHSMFGSELDFHTGDIGQG